MKPIDVIAITLSDARQMPESAYLAALEEMDDRGDRTGMRVLKVKRHLDADAATLACAMWQAREQLGWFDERFRAADYRLGIEIDRARMGDAAAARAEQLLVDIARGVPPSIGALLIHHGLPIIGTPVDLAPAADQFDLDFTAPGAIPGATAATEPASEPDAPPPPPAAPAADSVRPEAMPAPWFDAPIKGGSIAAERATKGHTLNVGDVLRAMWGYEQTNVDYYEVTRLIGRTMVEVREIAAQSRHAGDMSGECVPQPGHYIGEARRCRPSGAAVRIDGSIHASRIEPVAVVAGKPVYAVSRWTAYA